MLMRIWTLTAVVLLVAANAQADTAKPQPGFHAFGPDQTIVDIGSALDEVIKGRRTRGYHHPGSPTANRICRW